MTVTLNAESVSLLLSVAYVDSKQIITIYGEEKAVSEFDVVGPVGRNVSEDFKIKEAELSAARKAIGLMCEVALKDIEGKPVNKFQRKYCSLNMSETIRAELGTVKPSKKSVAAVVRNLIARVKLESTKTVLNAAD